MQELSTELWKLNNACIKIITTKQHWTHWHSQLCHLWLCCLFFLFPCLHWWNNDPFCCYEIYWLCAFIWNITENIGRIMCQIGFCTIHLQPILHHSKMFQQIIFLCLSLLLLLEVSIDITYGHSCLASNNANLQAKTYKDHTWVHKWWSWRESMPQSTVRVTMSGVLSVDPWGSYGVSLSPPW